MDSCLLCRRIKEFTGLTVNEFSLRVLHCGTTYYSRLINHEVEPREEQIKYLKDFLINYICNKKDDPLLEELYKIPFLSLKLEQYHLKSPDLSLDFFEQFETKILFSFLDEIIEVIQKRRNPKYQQEVLDKVISLIGDPKNIDFELVKNELKKLSLQ